MPCQYSLDRLVMVLRSKVAKLRSLFNGTDSI